MGNQANGHQSRSIERPIVAKAIVIGASFCLLIFGIGNMRSQFGDEYCYLDAARSFLARGPVTNLEHPPLAKYIMALSIAAFGDNPFGWRFPSVLAGALLAFAIFGMVHRLTGDTRTGLIAWVLSIAGGFWYFLSRLAMLSVYELAFEMTAIWLFLIALENDAVPTWCTAAWCAAGLFFGLSVASRWFGAMGLVACLGVAFYRRRFWRPCLMGLVAVLTYFVAWIPLLLRQHKPLSYLVEANLTIFRIHHSAHLWNDGEDWWTWVFRTEQSRSISPLIANPVIGVLGLIALAVIVFGPNRKRFALPALLFCAHFLPWVLGVKPVTYYYYYFEAYTFLAIALAIAISQISLKNVKLEAAVVGASLCYFVYWFPALGYFPPPFGGVFGYH